LLISGQENLSPKNAALREHYNTFNIEIQFLVETGNNSKQRKGIPLAIADLRKIQGDVFVPGKKFRFVDWCNRRFVTTTSIYNALRRKQLKRARDAGFETRAQQHNLYEKKSCPIASTTYKKVKLRGSKKASKSVSTISAKPVRDFGNF
jgi:hypothetical protein